MIKRKRTSSFVLGLIALGLTGCGDAVYTTRNLGVVTFSGDAYMQTTAANGTNAVVVRNNPFGSAADEAVITALRSRFASGQYRFVLGASAPDWNGYTFVLGFGAGVIGNQTQCANPNLPLLAAGGRTAVIADLCYGTRTVAETTGYTAPISGPNDPRFAKLIGDVVQEMLINRPNYMDGGGVQPR